MVISIFEWKCYKILCFLKNLYYITSMISKLEFQNIIEKYHLDGLIENVKWDIDKDKTLTIKFMSPTREMIGSVVYNNFPLPESSIGISNTTQLDKLLNITGGDLLLDYIKEGKVFTKLLISDNEFNLNYTLSDLLTIPKTGDYNGPEDYNISVDLDDEVMSALIKAKNALSNSDSVVVTPSLMGLSFIFGGDLEYSNKVTYIIQNPTFDDKSQFELIYGSDLLKAVLVANKGAESGALYLNSQGLMKLEFNFKGLKSLYYIVAKTN